MKTFMLVLAVIMLAAAAIFAMYQPLYRNWDIGIWFYHDLLGWHMPKYDDSKFDGVNTHNTCRHCEQPIMQDSQGNWFIPHV